MWNPFRRPPRFAAASASAVAPLALGETPTIVWSGTNDRQIALACPNCTGAARKRPLLAVTWKTPDFPTRTTRLLRCPDCTCLFYDDQNPPDYAAETLLERGRVPFYIQQNAGVSLITRPLARVERPAGSAYLEVGCGFGFGVDFARRARGWDARGIDPAPLSALGRVMLGIEIESRYLAPEDAAKCRYDVIFASETIEHVPSPAAFIGILRGALRPDGVLMLTTPDGAALTPAVSPGILVQMLSPGLHLVFQNRNSLRRLLEAAGFVHIEIETDALTLVAYASDAPLDLQRDPAICRKRYRDYLEARAAVAAVDGDLFIGVAGRALLEAVNDGDFAAGENIWRLFAVACGARFGLDLDSLQELPAAAAWWSLDDMARAMPLNLCTVLYAHAILQLHTGTPRPALEVRFALAAAAARTLRRALAELALDDGMAETIQWTATAEALLCAAEAGLVDTAERLRALKPAPSGAGGARRRREIVQRVLVRLVNAANYDQATAIVAAEALHAQFPTDAGALLDASERDALFCLAVLDLQPGGEVARARRNLQALRASFGTGGGRPPPANDVYWSAIRAEILACDMMQQPDDAAALRNAALASAGGDLSLLPTDLRPSNQNPAEPP